MSVGEADQLGAIWRYTPGLPIPHPARTWQLQGQDLPTRLSRAGCSQTCLQASNLAILTEDFNRGFLASSFHEILNGRNTVVLHRAAKAPIPKKCHKVLCPTLRLILLFSHVRTLDFGSNQLVRTTAKLCNREPSNTKYIPPITWVQAIRCMSRPPLWPPCFSHLHSHSLQSNQVMLC